MIVFSSKNYFPFAHFVSLNVTNVDFSLHLQLRGYSSL